MEQEGLQEEQMIMLEHLLAVSVKHCSDDILVRLCWGHQKSHWRRYSTQSLIKLINQKRKVQQVEDLVYTEIEGEHSGSIDLMIG